MEEEETWYEEEERSRFQSHVHVQDGCRKKRKQSGKKRKAADTRAMYIYRNKKQARQEEEEGSRYLSHIHLQDTLLEVAQLCPDVIINLPSRCHMFCGNYDAVPFHQPAPALSHITWFLWPYMIVAVLMLWRFLVLHLKLL